MSRQEINLVSPQDTLRHQRLLWLFLLNTLFSALIYVPAILILRTNVWSRMLLACLTLGIVFLGMELLARGKIKIAAHVSFALLWLTINLTTWITGGIERPAFTWNLLLLIVVSLIFGFRVTMIYTILSLVVGIMMVMARMAGYVPVPEFSQSPIPAAMAQFITLVSGAFYLGIGAHSYKNTLQTAREHAAIADYHNNQLQEEIRRRNQIEMELLDAKRAAESANKAKDCFLAMVSHELRTPLTPVVLVLDDLRRDQNLPAGLRHELTMVHHHVLMEARLIDDLLDVSRMASQKFRLARAMCDLHHAIESAADVCRPEIDARQIDLQFSNHAACSHIFGDSGRLQQVFWNILRNSAKFTGVGGRIVVRTWNEETTSTDGVKLFAEIRDNGVGIDPAVLPRLFHIFEQGAGEKQHQQGGLGIGLALSKAIVTAHGGSISIHSDGIGKGTRVLVQLEAVQSSVEPVFLPPEPEEPMPARSGLHLLLVEDHLQSAATLKSLLERDGHRVDLAHTVADAKRLLQHSRFDLLITDLGLPDGDGLQLAPLARDHGQVPAIALSGYGMDEDIERTRFAGFAAHVVKPVDMAHLRSAITIALQGEAKQLLTPA